jgi:hypothetical protein
VSDSLASKTEATVELEGQIATLQSSLESALADIKTNKGLAGKLAQEKSVLEAQLMKTREAMSSLQSEQQVGESVLESWREDVSFFCIVSAQSSAIYFSFSLPPQRLPHTVRTSLFRTFILKSKC